MNTPPSPEALLQLAASLRRQGRITDALAAVEKALELNQRHAQAWNFRGNLLLALDRGGDAIASYERALALNPDYAQARHNRGVALLGAGQVGEAEAEFRRVLSLAPNDADALFHLGAALASQLRHAEAVSAFNQAHAHGDSSPALFFSRAQSLLHLQDHAAALTEFDRALSLAGNEPSAWLGRGIALLRLNRIDEAIASFGECLRLRPDNKDALYNRANGYALVKHYERCAADCARLLQLDPQYPYALGLLLHARLYTCDWRDIGDLRKQAAQAVNAGRPAIHPFLHLAISDSPEEQLRSAKIFAAGLQRPPQPMWQGERYRHNKIRLAYLSADFYEHATAFLMAGVFEQHDRDRFEVHAISFGPADSSEMRRRLEAAFDSFSDLGAESDAAIAARIRALEIDIAIDLKGYTGGARPGILGFRPAPVQAHYLGYPGTMGSPDIDYLIADKIVLPREQHRFYTEQIIELPGSYQCNDAQRPIACRPNRAEAGLPAEGFVFCCFNSSFKITPEMYDVWMRILRRAPGSLLWLLESDPATMANLKREAALREIAAERLIFAPRITLEQHLARLALAGLALDSLPYGAHTTASDALWAGVPLLTCTGGTFAGRVAASLLTALDLTGWIASSLAEFETRAAQIATDPALASALRQELEQKRATSTLFDTKQITRNLEAAYTRMWQRHHKGEPPAAFAVSQ